MRQSTIGSVKVSSWPAGLPDRAIHEDGAVHADHVVALPHHDAPPIVLQVPLQLDAQRAVIPAAIEPSVDFARLKNKTAPFAKADDFFHPLGIGLGAAGS